MSPNKPSSKQSGPTTEHGRLVDVRREMLHPNLQEARSTGRISERSVPNRACP